MWRRSSSSVRSGNNVRSSLERSKPGLYRVEPAEDIVALAGYCRVRHACDVVVHEAKAESGGKRERIAYQRRAAPHRPDPTCADTSRNLFYRY